MKKALKIGAGFLFGAAFVFVGCSSIKKMFTGYNATIEDGIKNGSVKADKIEGISKEDTVTLSFSPADGYEWDTVSVKAGEKEEEVAVTANTFIMPSDDVKISATFKKLAPTKSKPDAVGDVVLNDGTAVSYENIKKMPAGQKAKAVAVIFYIGDECSNKGENRILGVGLVHESASWRKKDESASSASSSNSGSSWSAALKAATNEAKSQAKNFGTDSVNALLIDNSIDSIACEISVNNLEKAEKKAFSITSASKIKYDTNSYVFSGDKNGSDNLEQISAFLKNLGKRDDTAPVSSFSEEDLRFDEEKTKLFKGQNYPAFYFAKNYKDYKEDRIEEIGLFSKTKVRKYKDTHVGKYESGWYLPSIVELFQIWKNKDKVNKAISTCGGDEFGEDSSFLSSSQFKNMKIDGEIVKTLNGDDFAYCLIFPNGTCYSASKTGGGAVCAIREF